MPDHYRTLGVRPDISAAELARAYRKLVREWHPDRNLQRVGEATLRMQQINAAHDVLRDPERRAAYDAVRAREAEEQLARQLHEEWRAGFELARARGDLEGVYDLFLCVFGAHHERALHGAGPLHALWAACETDVRAAERELLRPAFGAVPNDACGAAPNGVSNGHAVPNAAPSAGAPRAGGRAAPLRSPADRGAAPAYTPSPMRPRRPGGHGAGLLVAGLAALAVAGRAAVGRAERRADATLAAARAYSVERDAPYDAGPVVEADEHGTGDAGEVAAGERAPLVSELRRLAAAMAAARRRTGAWPSRPPAGLVSRAGVRLQMGRAGEGWVGVATHVGSSTVCRLDVTVRRHELLRCRVAGGL